MLAGLFAAADDVLGKEHFVHPAFLYGLVQEVADFGVVQVLGIGIQRTYGRIALLVCAVLLQGIEAAGGLLGTLRYRLLEVTAGRGYRADKGNGAGLVIVQHHHARTGVEVGDDGGKVHRECVCTGKFFHTVTHFTKGLCPTGRGVCQQEALQTHGAIILAQGHGGVNGCFTGRYRHVGGVTDNGGTFHQVTAGVRVDELREFREDFHHLVGAFTAGGHHNDIGIALLGNGVLQHGFAATEGPGDKARTTFCDGVHGVDYTYPRFHDAVGTRFFLIAFDGHLYGPFLGHGDLDVFAFLVGENGNDRVDVIFSLFLDGLHRIAAFEGKRNHDFVWQPAFFYFTQPVCGLYFVTGFGDRGERPQFLVIQGSGVFAALEEHIFHGGQVVLQAIINTGEQAGAQLHFQHAALEFYGVAALEAAGALEHLHGSILSVHLDDLCHHLDALRSDEADLIFCNGTVNFHRNKVTYDTGYNSFCFHIWLLIMLCILPL